MASLVIPASLWTGTLPPTAATSSAATTTSPAIEKVLCAGPTIVRLETSSSSSPSSSPAVAPVDAAVGGGVSSTPPTRSAVYLLVSAVVLHRQAPLLCLTAAHVLGPSPSSISSSATASKPPPQIQKQDAVRYYAGGGCGTEDPSRPNAPRALSLLVVPPTASMGPSSSPSTAGGGSTARGAATAGGARGVSVGMSQNVNAALTDTQLQVMLSHPQTWRTLQSSAHAVLAAAGSAGSGTLSPPQSPQPTDLHVEVWSLEGSTSTSAYAKTITLEHVPRRAVHRWGLAAAAPLTTSSLSAASLPPPVRHVKLFNHLSGPVSMVAQDDECSIACDAGIDVVDHDDETNDGAFLESLLLPNASDELRASLLGTAVMVGGYVLVPAPGSWQRQHDGSSGSCCLHDLLCPPSDAAMRPTDGSLVSAIHRLLQHIPPHIGVFRVVGVDQQQFPSAQSLRTIGAATRVQVNTARALGLHTMASTAPVSGVSIIPFPVAAGASIATGDGQDSSMGTSTGTTTSTVLFYASPPLHTSGANNAPLIVLYGDAIRRVLRFCAFALTAENSRINTQASRGGGEGPSALVNVPPPPLLGLLVFGPRGCGKRAIVDAALRRIRDVSSNTSSDQQMQKAPPAAEGPSAASVEVFAYGGAGSTTTTTGEDSQGQQGFATIAGQSQAQSGGKRSHSLSLSARSDNGGPTVFDHVFGVEVTAGSDAVRAASEHLGGGDMLSGRLTQPRLAQVLALGPATAAASSSSTSPAKSLSNKLVAILVDDAEAVFPADDSLVAAIHERRLQSLAQALRTRLATAATAVTVVVIAVADVSSKARLCPRVRAGLFREGIVEPSMPPPPSLGSGNDELMWWPCRNPHPCGLLSVPLPSLEQRAAVLRAVVRGVWTSQQQAVAASKVTFVGLTPAVLDTAATTLADAGARYLVARTLVEVQEEGVRRALHCWERFSQSQTDSNALHAQEGEGNDLAQRFLAVASQFERQTFFSRAVTWDSIGGLEPVKRRLRDALIRPRLHPEICRRFGVVPPKGILLYGPPGCAKTTLIKALCGEGLFAFLYVDCASILSSYVGESEQFLRDVFTQARAQAPCLVFFDEVDAVSAKRSSAGGGGTGGQDDSARLLSTLLIELDGFSSAVDDVCFIGATNLPHVVDSALLRPGRFDYLVHVPLPNPAERYAILRAMLGITSTTAILPSPVTDPAAAAASHTPITRHGIEHGTDLRDLLSILPAAYDAVTKCAETAAMTALSDQVGKGEEGEAENDHDVGTEEDDDPHAIVTDVPAHVCRVLSPIVNTLLDGFSGADIAAVVKMACTTAQRRVEGGKKKAAGTTTTTVDAAFLTFADLEDAAAAAAPTQYDATQIDAFVEQHEKPTK